MKTEYKIFISLVIVCSSISVVRTQTPSDDIMMKQRESCVAVIYEHSWFDEYWEGTRLRSNGTIATVKRNMALPMIAIGIFDKLNLYVGAPYVQTESSEPNGGKFAGAKGFQDLSLAVKGEIVNKQVGSGELAFFAAAGFSTPLTNYLSDYRPYSIGFGADEFSLRSILRYKWANGIYALGSLAFLKRGSTKAERDYYYNNGSYYTAWMDVPDAWNYNVAAGVWLFDNTLKVEASYKGLKSTSGDDIRPYNAPQPTNKESFDQLGFFGQYYFGKSDQIGVLTYFSNRIGGRNTGKAFQVGAGMTYVFKI